MIKNSLDPLKTSSYHFSLPDELIASSPANPKDHAKLLVYERSTNTITHTIFKHILDFIPKDTAIVLNDTKVIKARLYGQKQTGGKIELLINKPYIDNEVDCYIKGKVKVNTKLLFDHEVSAIVKERFDNGLRRVAFFYQDKKVDFNELVELLQNIGHIPLPPYIQREDNKEDETDYQTLFAKENGAIAAPTASLHFTPALLEKMKEQFKTYFLTLHVGAGTFKPVESEEILNHPMHSENCFVPSSTQYLLDSEQALLAVGTTVTRTIEFYHRHKQLSGEANLFLHPHNQPQRVNYLLTNFHLPQSTLLMLVASFIGVEKSLELYHEAIKHQYKFYSYGDAMLIL
jgi:S-adenosylmethionine:tRNA ribosyltransferase-isomerase